MRVSASPMPDSRFNLYKKYSFQYSDRHILGIIALIILAIGR